MKQINMEEVKAVGDFSRPSAGAYICKITEVEDIEDREYLKITYDIDQGEFKGYYTELRENHPDWDWAGVFARSYKPAAFGFFKRFCEAVSKSNGKYIFDAGKINSDETTLVDKKIGIVFQEEEYYGNDGSLRTRLIVNKEFPIDKLNDQKVPPVKKVARPATEFVSVDVAEGTDAEVPF
jgi:hypothetical protein